MGDFFHSEWKNRSQKIKFMKIRGSFMDIHVKSNSY